MTNLLSAGFTRLFKEKLFYICVAVMAVYGVMSVLSANPDHGLGEYADHLDDVFFEYCSLIPVLMSVFCSMFIGTEYGDGTMRNKIIGGHKRAAVYMSNFIISAAAGLMMYAACAVTCIGFGIPILGLFTGELGMIFVRIGCSFTLLLALTGIFTMIALLVKSKSVSAVVSVLLAFMTLLVASILYSLLSQPEYIRDYNVEAVYYENGEQIIIPEGESKLIPNPSYVSGTKRKIYQFIVDFTPGGQVIEIATGDMSPPLLLVGYSMIITAGTTAAGLVLFNRKNLN